VELTPRAPRTAGAGRRSIWPKAVIVLVVAALGVVAVQGLDNAAIYFHNADEAVAMRDDLGDRRFRLQGSVVEGSIRRGEGGAEFDVVYNGEQVRVTHAGSTPEMFQDDIPVVLEGRWSATAAVFESDRILVKHSEEYEADHGDRIEDAEGASTGSGPDADRGSYGGSRSGS
jgi:cytochrome c-type biogenesis protein CcmE